MGIFRTIKAKMIVLFCSSILLSTACETPDGVMEVGESVVVVDTPSSGQTPAPVSTTPTIPDDKLVCDPFSNNPNHPGSDYSHGIVAQLRYLAPSSPKYNKVADYKKYGVPVDATLFFSQINVPTRAFSLGFMTVGGQPITIGNGNVLYEYFSVHFDSQIQLTANDPVGPYQFAVLSDDGAVFQIDTGSGLTKLIDNDGDTPTRLRVSQTPVVFENQSTILPIHLDYYQGPRYHIAMILLWRPWPTSGSGNESLNGKSGNDYFFNSATVPSTPQAPYNQLLSRGWKPIPAENFILPTSVSENPCTADQAVTTTLGQVIPSEASTLSSQISFSFSSNFASATYQCRFDGGALTPCQSPQTYSGVLPGAHEFRVYATANGKTDTLGAQYSWTVLAPVSTSVASSLPLNGSTNSTSISLLISSNYPEATFQCSLDGAAQTNCSSSMSYSGLADGTHTFRAYATARGQTDSTGATYSWTVDTVAPKILSSSVSVTSSSFTVTWVTDEPATSRFSWGAGTTVDQTVPEDLQRVTQHSVTIQGVSPMTIYSFSFGGADQAGNTVTSAVFRTRTSQ